MRDLAEDVESDQCITFAEGLCDGCHAGRPRALLLCEPRYRARARRAASSARCRRVRRGLRGAQRAVVHVPRAPLAARDIAEDLLEETWLRLVKHAGRLRADTRLAPWLFTVARNLHVSFIVPGRWRTRATAGLMALWPVARNALTLRGRRSRRTRAPHRTGAGLHPVASSEVLLLVGVAGLDHSDAADFAGLRRKHSANGCIGRVKHCLRRLTEMRRGDAGAGRNDVMSEPLIRLLADLRPAEPDPARAERTRYAAVRGFAAGAGCIRLTRFRPAHHGRRTCHRGTRSRGPDRRVRSGHSPVRRSLVQHARRSGRAPCKPSPASSRYLALEPPG